MRAADGAGGTDASDRRRHELVICAAVATAIVLLQSIVPLFFERYFDSDQAVYGLMAKHLSEGRAFPLYFYGQNYMLGVQSWLAVPFFWIGGPTVAMLRTPIVLLNLAVALGYLWWLARLGLRPAHALAAALPVIAFTPVKSLEFGAVYGAGIEPFGYALVLWLLRRRPIAFGAVLGFGTLHREFTFLVLPALAAALAGDRAFRSPLSLAKRGAGFLVVWLVIDLIKRNVNVYGPAGGTWAAGSVTLGAQTHVKWLSFDWSAYALRIWELLTWGLPDMLGARPYLMRAYATPSDLEVGSLAAGFALLAAIVFAIARSIWLGYRGGARLPIEHRRLFIYLVSLAVLNVLVYGLNSSIVPGFPPPLRYAIFAPLVVIAIFLAYFTLDRTRRWPAAVAIALAIWAAGSVVDNVRMVREFVHGPAQGPHRIVADHLMNRGIRYARAGYWDAYVIAFLSRERVIVASTETIRVSAYQAQVEAHAAEAVTLVRLPCEGGTRVAAWCVIGPDGR